MRNGQKQYINIDADDVKFEDGDSFQEKLTAGALKGEKGDKGDKGTDGANGTNGINGVDGVSPQVSITEGTGTHTIEITDKTGTKSTVISDGSNGETGPAGPAGSDANVTRTNVINALGYTPSNSGLTQAEVEQMINSNKKKNISVVKLPFISEQYGSADYDPPSDSVGISTFLIGSNFNNEVEYHDMDGTVHNNASNEELGAFFAGLTVHTDEPKVGFHLGAHKSGLYIKFKGTDDYTSYNKNVNENLPTSWIQIINRYGVVNNANSLILMEYYSGYASSNYKNWDFSGFRKGLSTFAMSMDGNIYFALLFNFGNKQPNAKFGYSAYNASESKGTLFLIPHDFANPAKIWALKLQDGKPTAYKFWSST